MTFYYKTIQVYTISCVAANIHTKFVLLYPAFIRKYQVLRAYSCGMGSWSVLLLPHIIDALIE